MEKDINKEGRKYAHIGFEIGLVLKGIDGALEIIGAILLCFLTPDRLDTLTKIITRTELAEDPKDLIANILLSISRHFSINAQDFGIVYLMTHGLVKCFIIYLLWRKKLWAYPFTIVTFLLFIIYQVYEYTTSSSIFLILLTVFDVIMIILTYIEYQRMKSQITTE